MQRRSPFLDRLAIGASFLCLVHCLLLPVLILLLPTLAVTLAIPEEFHLWLLVVAVPTSIFALRAGYRRHDRALPTAIVLPGLALLAAGASIHDAAWLETSLTVAGAIVLSIGHALNLRVPPIPTATRASARA